MTWSCLPRSPWPPHQPHLTIHWLPTSLRIATSPSHRPRRKQSAPQPHCVPQSDSNRPTFQSSTTYPTISTYAGFSSLLYQRNCSIEHQNSLVPVSKVTALTHSASLVHVGRVPTHAPTRSCSVHYSANLH